MKARPKGLHPDCELVIQWSREKGITLKNVTDNAVLKKEKTNLFPTQDAKRWAQHKREKDKKRKKPIKLPDGYDPRHSLLEPHEKLNTPTSTMPKKDGVDDATKAFGKLGLENKYDKVTTLHEDNAKNLPHHTSFKTIPNVLSREGDHRVQAASVKLPVLQVNQRIYDGEFRLAKEGAGQGIISSEYFDLRTLEGLNGKDEGMANLQFGPEQQRLELHNQEIYKHVKKSGGPDKEESFWSQVRQFYPLPGTLDGRTVKYTNAEHNEQVEISVGADGKPKAKVVGAKVNDKILQPSISVATYEVDFNEPGDEDEDATMDDAEKEKKEELRQQNIIHGTKATATLQLTVQFTDDSDSDILTGYSPTRKKASKAKIFLSAQAGMGKEVNIMNAAKAAAASREERASVDYAARANTSIDPPEGGDVDKPMHDTPSASQANPSKLDDVGGVAEEEEQDTEECQKQRAKLEELTKEIDKIDQARRESGMDNKTVQELITQLSFKIDKVETHGSKSLRKTRKSTIQKAEGVARRSEEMEKEERETAARFDAERLEKERIDKERLAAEEAAKKAAEEAEQKERIEKEEAEKAAANIKMPANDSFSSGAFDDNMTLPSMSLDDLDKSIDEEAKAQAELSEAAKAADKNLTDEERKASDCASDDTAAELAARVEAEAGVSTSATEGDPAPAAAAMKPKPPSSNKKEQFLRMRQERKKHRHHDQLRKKHIEQERLHAQAEAQAEADASEAIDTDGSKKKARVVKSTAAKHSGVE